MAHTNSPAVASLRRVTRSLLTIALLGILTIGLVRQERQPLAVASPPSPPATADITLITRNSPQCYAMHQDQPVGFEYELASRLADELGVGLRVVVAEQWSDMLKALETEPKALIAAEVAATPERRRNVAFSRAYRHTQSARSSEVSGPDEDICWAVRPSATAWLERVNAFLERSEGNGLIERLEQRYYASNDTLETSDVQMFHTRLRSRWPEFQSLVVDAAQRHGFDWRLISALIYQESHFDPKAAGPGGALGLMQLTPTTAMALGVEDPRDPRQSIEAGVRYLKDLLKGFPKAEQDDRLLLAIAAYNIGRRNLGDARTLARRKKLDPDRWSSLEHTLPLLATSPLGDTLSDLEPGRGLKTVSYIKRILAFYDILCQRDLLAQLPGERSIGI